MPSSQLEEEIVAKMLLQAKRRFVKRNTAPQQPPTPEIKQSVEESDSQPSSQDPSIDSQDDNSESDGDVKRHRSSSPSFQKDQASTKTYQPILSANDDRSSQILKPSARHILTNLDTTLSILHKMRSTAQNEMSESSEAETSDSQTSQKRRKVGRPRLPPATAASQVAAAPSKKGSGRGRGRPKKVHIPLEGETEEEMRIRLARQNHRRIPYTEAEKQKAFGDWVREGDERLKKQAASDADDDYEDDGDNLTGIPAFNAQAQMHRKAIRLRNRRKKMRRWGVRDWSDVLAAASLAGFSGDVIQRTAARCATLFQESISIDQLHEVGVPKAKPKPKGKDKDKEQSKSKPKPAGFKSTVHNPQTTVNESEPSSSDEEETAAQTLEQRRIAARHASLARASRESSRGRSPFYPSSESGGVQASRSGSRSRSTSSTRVSYCPISTCSRAAAGFTRKTNLRRHMRLVHPDVGDDWVEEDSDDQMYGAVHVDGFLQRIKMQKGWRGQDQMKRKRRSGHDESSARSSPRKRRGSDDYV